jgi:hypothetical protein
MPREKRDWKSHEDWLLEKLVAEFGGNWALISDIMSR